MIPRNDSPAPYPHWMLREIHEQPAVIEATLARYIDDAGFRSDTCAPIRRWLRSAGAGIVIAASGSSRHAALMAELMIEDLSGLPVDVEYASEYGVRTERARSNAAVMVVSQSGETADTLAALRKAIRLGHPTLAITNAAESTMAREADASFPTAAGPERAIPATKSFTAQLLNLYLLALLAGELLGTLTAAALMQRLHELAGLANAVRTQLHGWRETVGLLIPGFSRTQSFLFLGRGMLYAIAREGALKLKESAYLHAEGYPGGEFRHGPNALIGEGTVLVMLMARDPHDAGSVERYDSNVRLLNDMRDQGAEILALANRNDDAVRALAPHTIALDPMPEPLLCLSAVIPLQMLAYGMAVARGIDVDRPRHLTKAVLTR